jgi:hypothetical protein
MLGVIRGRERVKGRTTSTTLTTTATKVQMSWKAPRKPEKAGGW